jgi:hypothetical protein
MRNTESFPRANVGRSVNEKNAKFLSGARSAELLEMDRCDMSFDAQKRIDFLDATITQFQKERSELRRQLASSGIRPSLKYWTASDITRRTLNTGLVDSIALSSKWVNAEYYEAFRNAIADGLGVSRASSDWELEEVAEATKSVAKIRYNPVMG